MLTSPAVIPAPLRLTPRAPSLHRPAYVSCPGALGCGSPQKKEFFFGPTKARMLLKTRESCGVVRIS